MPGLADSAFWLPPIATSMPHASNSNGTAPSDDTTSTITMRAGLVRDLRELLDRLDHAGRGLGLGEQDGLHRVLGEGRRDLVGPDPGRPTRTRCVRTVSP